MRARDLWSMGYLVLAIAPALSAQPLDRLTGKVLTERGEPVTDTDVRIEALFGFAGGDFTGQRTFTARTNGKGGWALIGFKASIWAFDTSAPGQIPDAVALPFHLVAPPGSSMSGLVPAWHRVLKTAPLPAGETGQILADGAEAARAGRPERVTPLLARLSDSVDANVLAAAGRICILMRDPTVARPFFRHALDRDPTSFRAALGMGSTALMQRDVDAAARAFGDARDRTKDKDERSDLTTAINELNKAHSVMRGTY